MRINLKECLLRYNIFNSINETELLHKEFPTLLKSSNNANQFEEEKYKLKK